MGTFVVGALLAGIVFLAIRSMVRDKKSGKSLQCGGNCSRCKGHCGCCGGSAEPKVRRKHLG